MTETCKYCESEAEFMVEDDNPVCSDQECLWQAMNEFLKMEMIE